MIAREAETPRKFSVETEALWGSAGGGDEGIIGSRILSNIIKPESPRVLNVLINAEVREVLFFKSYHTPNGQQEQKEKLRGVGTVSRRKSLCCFFFISSAT